MTVSLIHCTPEAEKLIVKMARVSAPENADNFETGPRLLRYLIKHRHWSPFEMASMCVQIDTERDIAAQVLRHRSFSFQEFSTRYAVTEKAISPALRRQDTQNRQNSIDDIDPAVIECWETAIDAHFAEAYRLYKDMLDVEVAKETARRILPLCTPTTMYMHGTLRSWIHYIDVRTDVSTQLEHRQIANQCKNIFCESFPVIGQACWPDSKEVQK
jgi:thymidylate synthase (FAD)